MAVELLAEHGDHPGDPIPVAINQGKNAFDLLPKTFESEETLAKTLAHERHHIWQLRGGLPNRTPADRDSMEQNAWALNGCGGNIIR